MDNQAELEELRRKIQIDPNNEVLVKRFRALLDRMEGVTPFCARCKLNTHMIRGRVTTKNYYSWTEAGQSEVEQQLRHKRALHLVGWRCLICNIITLASVERRDQTLDWVNNEYIDPNSGLD